LAGRVDYVSIDTVDVWLVDADLAGSRLATLAAVLDDRERQRASQRCADRSRRRFVAAHGAARLIVGERLGVPPEQLRWRRGEHGKPELAGDRTGLRVSLSHSGELAMVAVAGHRPVGVDIQRLPGGLPAERLAARYFSGAEARWVAEAEGAGAQVDRLVRLWVRKEACVKAAGGRLMQGMRLPVGTAGAAALVADPSRALPGPWLVNDVPAPRGFRAAVALAGAGPYRVARHRWEPGHESRSERPVLARNTSSRLGR
jgi:4'-phosphopantetheinyl transferase